MSELAPPDINQRPSALKDLEGKRFPPDLARRIQERANKIRRRLAPIDVNTLIHETGNT